MKKVPAKMLLNPLHFLSLGFGSGLLPKAPGTFGSVAGLILYWFLLKDVSPAIAGSIVMVMCVLGIPLCAYTAKALDTHDHPAIVWDEICGIAIPLFICLHLQPLPVYEATTIGDVAENIYDSMGQLSDTGRVVLIFVFFRIFDIWKPWPIRALDKNLSGGLGIMLDDLLAGLFAAAVVSGIHTFFSMMGQSYFG